MWCDVLHYLNAKGFPELARGERLAMAGGVSARDRHPASGCSKKGRDQRRGVGNRATWLPKTLLGLRKRPAFAIRLK